MWSNICSLKQGFWKSEMRNEIYIFFIKKKVVLTLLSLQFYHEVTLKPRSS